MLAYIVPSNPKDKMENVELQKVIYFDGLTKDKLFDSLSTVLRCIETISEVFNKLSATWDKNNNSQVNSDLMHIIIFFLYLHYPLSFGCSI